MLQGRWARPLLLVLVAALALYGAALAQANLAAVGAALLRIGPATAALGGSVCVAAILLRFVRWQLLLACFGTPPAWRQSLGIYWAGIALTWTPGKVGETLRSALLKPHGIAIPDSLAAFLADRMSDVIGVALLGLIAASWAGLDTELFIGIVGLGGIASLAASTWVRRGRLPERWRLIAPLRSWSVLWRPARVPAWVLLGGLAYGLQAAVFGLFAQAVSPELSLAACIAAFAAALFVGAASMLPAGLGAMEATLAFALTRMGAAWDDAVAVTLLTRLCTLWIPSGMGVLVLPTLLRTAPAPLSPAQA